MSETKDIALSSKSIKSVELDGERQLRVIATAPTLDRDLEVIDTDTIKVPVKPRGMKYASDLTETDEIDVPFLIDHEWALEKQAGYIKRLYINAGGELEAIVQLSNVDNGDRVYQLAKDGALGNSFSIGFTLQNATVEDGIVKNIELLELSAVFKGSNRDARLLEVKSVKGQNMSKAEKLQSDIEARRMAGEKAVTDNQEKVKGLIADILNSDTSWETEDEKWEMLEPINELFWALREAWFFSTTSIEDFNTLVNEFATLVGQLANGTKEVTVSEELTKALGETTVDDIKQMVEKLPIAKQAEAEAETEEAEETQEETQGESEAKTTEDEKTEEVKEEENTNEAETEVEAEKEVKMTEAEKKSIKTAEAVQDVQTKSFDKVDHAAKQFAAYLAKDAKKLKELNEEALKTYTGTKATYLNTGVTADGGAIVPSAQLLEDVYTTLDTYSSVASDIRVVTLESGDSLDIASLVDDVVMTEVATEGGDKDVTKPTFAESDISLREFAGIAILTKKLVRQAAVNVYDILRNSFARAIARKRAELILTDATSGIVNNANVTTIDTAADIPTYAELTSAAWEVPVGAVAGAKYYLSREALGVIAQETDAAGNSYVTLDGEAGLSGRFRNGFRFSVEEALGVNGAPHAVFGNFARFGILLRQGAVESETFDTGIVVDGSNVEHNLLQQNKLAHRVAFYENAGFPVPAAFAVFEQGS